jgi:hypothetical protein
MADTEEILTMIRTYSELIKLPTFKERFEYLSLKGCVGKETFGWERYINQAFYRSKEWKDVRNFVIVRDCGCDLGILGREIPDRILIHHMNPIIPKDIVLSNDFILDPEYLICTTHNTHEAIHYGSEDLLISEPVERMPNDTCPWKC